MKKYKIILADPPWSYSYMNSIHGGRGQKQYYECMRCVDIYELPIEKISNDDCALFLWATFPMLPEALHTIKSWGFNYKTVAFTWIKLNKKSKTPFFGMGQWTRTNAEMCLLGVKGNIKRQNADVSQVILSSRENHSRKPSETRERIVRLMGDLPRIELFARKEKWLFEDESFKGWDVWGNEVENDIEL